MKNSDVLLFFLFSYNIIITIIFTILFLREKKEYYKIDRYNEELNFELAKMRRKCYYKNRKEKE